MNKSVIDGGMTDSLEEIIKIQNQEEKTDCLVALAGKLFDYKALSNWAKTMEMEKWCK